MSTTIGIIGFGEAGSTFSAAAGWGVSACAFDVLDSRKKTMRECGVCIAETAADVLADAPLVLSLVTADQALRAAQACAPMIAKGAIWCDMNSVAPDTKRAAAQAIEAAGGRYVDVAVRAPVNPARMAVPLLLAGESAEEARKLLVDAGFTNVRVVGEDVGRASSIKMIRSVMVKGIEGLTAEMMQAAIAAGVVDEVLASLDASEQRKPWSERAEYNVERMVTHGLRRAAEMEESAKTLLSLGVEPVMTAGTVRRQREQAGKPLHRS